MLDLLLRVLAFAAGAALVIYTVMGAIRSFVLPRNDLVITNKWTYLIIRRLFSSLTSLFNTFAQRDRIMAMYAPTSLIMLEISWLLMVAVGYTGIYWGIGEGSLIECFKISNSALLTLGSDDAKSIAGSILTYSEATFGLLLLTLLISYLPTIYQAYSRRELVVARLERRAGTPMSAPVLLIWLNRTGSLLDDGPQWEAWEEWFVELEENHTSLPVLVYFRSPQSGRSWITAMGTLLDAAALIMSTVDQRRDPKIELCFKAGCVALNRVSRYFQERIRSTPEKYGGENDPMKDPQRDEFMRTYDLLAETSIPLVSDKEAAWEKYHLLRRHYSHAVEYLAKLTMAPDLKPITPQADDTKEADK
ncbi:hypothetical protein [Hymenobacter radiodurans]|uniref:hypothetical protein n=1 Tax=Hymenobacter radiodurans TaxID=2496028 RepID=UPI001059130D|nr:hypothetical protein [Hymenobacter radiodurans]